MINLTVKTLKTRPLPPLQDPLTPSGQMLRQRELLLPTPPQQPLELRTATRLLRRCLATDPARRPEVQVRAAFFAVSETPSRKLPNADTCSHDTHARR